MTRLPVYLAIVLFATALLGLAEARYAAPELVDVPIDRLIENVEKAISGLEAGGELPGGDAPDPKRPPKESLAVLRHRLARLHALAWATKSATTQVNRAWGRSDEPWFGHEPRHLPFEATVTEDAGKEKVARAHLGKAIETYRRAVEEAPEDPVVRLGYAWVLDQSGAKEAAIPEYRKVVEGGWAREGKLTGAPMGENYVTVEAAQYLIPLLDRDRDAEEIGRLRERIRMLKALPIREITPIAIPLRPGLRPGDLVDRSARVRFDLDGSGLRREWEWIRPEAAWLVHDPRGTGQVASALQMFGNVTFWVFWEDGYAALRALDDDGDGRLAGAELAGLALWHDRDADGVTAPGEVRSLAEWGIVSLGCGSPRTEAGLLCHPEGVRFADGTTRPSWDLVLRSR